MAIRLTKALVDVMIILSTKTRYDLMELILQSTVRVAWTLGRIMGDALVVVPLSTPAEGRVDMGRPLVGEEFLEPVGKTCATEHKPLICQ